MIMPLTCQNSRAQGRRRDCTQCTGRQCTQCTGIRFWSGGQWPSVMQCPAQWRHSTWLPAHNTPLWLQAQYHSHERVQRADTCLWRWQSDNQGTKWMLTRSDWIWSLLCGVPSFCDEGWVPGTSEPSDEWSLNEPRMIHQDNCTGFGYVLMLLCVPYKTETANLWWRTALIFMFTAGAC